MQVDALMFLNLVLLVAIFTDCWLFILWLESIVRLFVLNAILNKLLPARAHTEPTLHAYDDGRDPPKHVGLLI
jgi:hypothetical protein